MIFAIGGYSPGFAVVPDIAFRPGIGPGIAQVGSHSHGLCTDGVGRLRIIRYQGLAKAQCRQHRFIRRVGIIVINGQQPADSIRVIFGSIVIIIHQQSRLGKAGRGPRRIIAAFCVCLPLLIRSAGAAIGLCTVSDTGVGYPPVLVIF